MKSYVQRHDQTSSIAVIASARYNLPNAPVLVPVVVALSVL